MERVWWIGVGCVVGSENDDVQNEVGVHGYGKAVLVDKGPWLRCCVLISIEEDR